MPVLRKLMEVEVQGSKCLLVPLTRNLFAYVDTQDGEVVGAYNWCAVPARGTYYAVTHIRDASGRRALLALHRVVGGRMGINGRVDHKSGNGLDDRRENLRPGPPNLNSANKGKQRTHSSSRYKGVSWDSTRSKWVSQIETAGKSSFLGRFKEETEAAKAYDKAAILAWGEYARLNFPRSRHAYASHNAKPSLRTVRP
jgi:hypothetical protein